MEDIKLIARSSYLLRVLRKDYNPFTPNRITITAGFIEYSRRNWYLISVNRMKFHFKSAFGVDIKKQVFGADVVIDGMGAKIVANGFTKKTADKIYSLVGVHISKYASNTNVTNVITNELSTSDELRKLKQLHDDGLLNQAEFDAQKAKLLSK